MKITLVNPPISLEDVYGRFRKLASFQPPVGLASLAGYLLPHGHEVQIIDCNALGMSVKQAVREIQSNPPDLLGLYTISYNYPCIERLVKGIRDVNKSLKIVAGGPHVTFLPEQTLEDTTIDYCVLGEGEETLLELVQRLDGDLNNRDLSDVAGLAYRSSDGEIIVTSERLTVKDIDSIPFPAIHLLPSLGKYELYLLHHKRLPYMTVASSRGCPYKCVFCETPSGKTVRAHSPEYVVDYLGHLSKDYGVKEAFFVDDTFTLNEKRVLTICDLMLKKNLDLTWSGTAHANVKNMDMFKVMRKAGCWIVALGAETGNQKIIDTLDKGTTLENIRATAKGITDAGLKLKTFFVLGNPGDTIETIDETIQFAKLLKGHFPVFSLMTPYPGAPLWKTAEQYGTFDRSGFDKLLLATSDPVFVPYGLTQKDLISKQKEAFRTNYFSVGMVLRHLQKTESLHDFMVLVKAFIQFLKVQFTFIKQFELVGEKSLNFKSNKLPSPLSVETNLKKV